MSALSSAAFHNIMQNKLNKITKCVILMQNYSLYLVTMLCLLQRKHSIRFSHQREMPPTKGKMANLVKLLLLYDSTACYVL